MAIRGQKSLPYICASQILNLIVQFVPQGLRVSERMMLLTGGQFRDWTTGHGGKAVFIFHDDTSRSMASQQGFESITHFSPLRFRQRLRFATND
jgi:hypothetical protein